MRCNENFHVLALARDRKLVCRIDRWSGMRRKLFGNEHGADEHGDGIGGIRGIRGIGRSRRIVGDDGDDGNQGRCGERRRR